MKTKIIILIIVIWVLSAHLAWGLTIITPSEGEIVYAGTRLKVIVKPDLGEQWEEVLIGIFPMSHNFLTNEYKEEIEIPKKAMGIIDFSVLAYDKAGKKIKLVRKLFVKLPPNVVLIGITAGSKVVSGSTLVLLEKMPAGSSAAEIENYEKAELRVYGNYSDSVNRELTSSSSGTTYTSSNEKIVTVNAEGKVTAQGLGEAKVTVKNSGYSASVDIVVKPYRQPQK